MITYNPNIERNKIPVVINYVLDKYNIELTEEETKELQEKAYYHWCKENNFSYIRGMYNL